VVAITVIGIYNKLKKNIMKYNFLRSITVFTSAFLMLLIAGCVKSRSGFTDLSKTSDFVILMGSGTGNFKASNILVNTTSPDTVKKTITADLASANSNGGAVTVTIGLDNTVIAAYNAANGTNFQPFPASAYKLVSSTITIPGGISHYGTTTVWIFQNQLDPTVSYILPVSITDGGGKSLSSNQNTIYYNVIGNPLAGNYKQDFYRWNVTGIGVADTTTAPNSTVTIGTPIVIAPVTATTILLPESYLETFVGVGMNLSFTNTAGVLSNFSVSLDANAVAAIAAGGFTILTQPKLVGYQIVGNASTKYAGSVFRTYMAIVNSGGNTRTVIDQYVKQ
jgi:hypothetical protein